LASKKSRPILGGIIFLIIGFLHILIPAWGIIIPDVGASFYWYWGFYFAGSGGDIETGIGPYDALVTAGRTAMTVMIIGFVIVLITLILVKALNTLETKKNLVIFGIIWLITGILLVIGPSIYLAEISDSIFDEHSWAFGLIFSYGLAIIPIILGIAVLYMHFKGETVEA
jgi:hypothetical protein